MKSVVLSNGCRTLYRFGLSSFEVMKQGESRAGCVSLVSSLNFDVYITCLSLAKWATSSERSRMHPTKTLLNYLLRGSCLGQYRSPVSPASAIQCIVGSRQFSTTGSSKPSPNPQPGWPAACRMDAPRRSCRWLGGFLALGTGIVKIYCSITILETLFMLISTVFSRRRVIFRFIPC